MWKCNFAILEYLTSSFKLTKRKTTEKLNRYMGNFFFQNGTRGSLTFVSKLNTCFLAVRNFAK